MNPARAWRDGIRRVAGAPLILAGVWLMTTLVSLPLTLALRGEITNHLGASLAAETAASGVNYEWMQEFADQATGLGTTLKPTILGFGAVLDNLSAFMDNTSRPLVIVGAAGAYIVLWLFAAGGIIDRYARDRATVDMRGTVVVERSAVSDDDLAWIQGRLVFRDAPLILVGAELYRWYGVRLRVADSSLANLHLTASFSGEPVDRVLNVIALSLGARIERQGNVAILHRAAPSGARP